MLAIPSPDLLVNLFASGAQVVGLLAVALGGSWLTKARSDQDDGQRAHSRWPARIAWLLVVAVSVSFGMYALHVEDLKSQRLQTNLLRTSKEAGKKVGDTSLKTLGLSDQLKHPQALASEKLAEWIAAGKQVNMIDIREPEEIELGQIPGTWARRYPDLRVHREGLVVPGAETVLLCDSGNRSSELVDKFKEEGILCRFMIGGYEKWVAEGRPLDHAAPRTTLRDIADYPNKHVLLDTPDVAALVEQGAVFVDVRYPEEFAKGALPNATNLTLRKMLAEEIEPALRGLPKKPIIVPCYDKRSSFFGMLLGLRLHRMGLDFRGRYTVPHEYYVPGTDPAHLAAWKAEQEKKTLFSVAASAVAVRIDEAGRYLGILLAILLTVVLARLLLVPFTWKSDRDQVVMRGLKPKIEALRLQLAGSPAQLRREILGLQREAGLTPVRNLLGTLLMLVVFLVLFAAVNVVAVEHATPFLWLPSIGSPDPLHLLPLAVGGVFLLMLVAVAERRTGLRMAFWGALAAVITAAVWSLPAMTSFYLLASLGLMLVQRAVFLAWWNRKEQRRLCVPPRVAAKVCADRPILDLVHVEHVTAAGRKAQRLSALLAAGFPVPPGYVVVDPSGLTSRAGRQRIFKAFARLRTASVAVRSSGVSEDGAESSHAGEYDSKLKVTRQDLLASISQVEGSLQAPHSGDQTRADHGGVIVQAMVPAEHAGVLFTEDPSCAGAMLVEMTKGLGDNLVAGLVNPDGYRFGRLSLRPLQRNDAPPIDLRALLELGKEAEKLFGRPQDIEWAWADGKFWILQSRDITCRAKDTAELDHANASAQREAQRAELLAHARDERDPEHALLSQNELSELLPEPTPLSLQLMNELWAQGGSVDRAAQRLGIPYDVASDSAPYAVSVFGKLYVNRREEKRRFARGIGALASLRLTRSAAMLEQDYRERFLPRFRREVRMREAVDPSMFSFAELVETFREAKERFVTKSYVEAEVINLASTFFTNVARQRLLRAGRSPAELLGAIHPTILPKLVAKLRLCGEEGLVSSLAEFGHRAPHDFELAEPRYGEDLAETRRLVAAAQAGTEATRTLAGEDQKLGRVDAVAVKTARTFEALKEEAKHEVLRELACLRRLVVEIGERLGLGNGVFWLLPEEIASSQPAQRAQLESLVAGRRAAHAAGSAIELPAEVSFAALETIGSQFAYHVQTSTTRVEALQGLRVAGTGDVFGRARVLRDPRETATFEDGDVLVARFTDPRWLPLFRRARGIVTEVGGWLSHAAIQAREHRLPAIVGVRGVMSEVRDGDLVCLRADGTVETVADRRRRTRLAESAPVRIVSGASWVAGEVLDRSETGLGVKVAASSLEVGDEVDVDFGDTIVAAKVAQRRADWLGLSLVAPLARSARRLVAVG